MPEKAPPLAVSLLKAFGILVQIDHKHKPYTTGVGTVEILRSPVDSPIVSIRQYYNTIHQL